MVAPHLVDRDLESGRRGLALFEGRATAGVFYGASGTPNVLMIVPVKSNVTNSAACTRELPTIAINPKMEFGGIAS
jgi:hypothetical protein